MLSKLLTILDECKRVPVVVPEREMLPDGRSDSSITDSKLSIMVRSLRHSIVSTGSTGSTGSTVPTVSASSDAFRCMMELIDGLMNSTNVAALPIETQIDLSNLYDRYAGSLVLESYDKYMQAASMSTSRYFPHNYDCPSVMLTRLADMCVESTYKSMHEIDMPEFHNVLDKMASSVFQRDVTLAMQLHQSVWLRLARRFASGKFFNPILITK